MKPINVKMTAKPLTYDELRDAVKLHPYLDSRFSVVSYDIFSVACLVYFGYRVWCGLDD